MAASRNQAAHGQHAYPDPVLSGASKKNKKKKKGGKGIADMDIPPEPVPAPRTTNEYQQAIQAQLAQMSGRLEEILSPLSDDGQEPYSDDEEGREHVMITGEGAFSIPQGDLEFEYEDGHMPPLGGLPAPPGGVSKKKKKKKKKTSSTTIHAGEEIARFTIHHPPQHHRQHREGIWNTSSNEERQRIKEFWLQLGEEERRSLVKVEKETVLKKMKEQQKHSCSCSVCGRKRSWIRTAIEEELEVLYDAYYQELERYANHQQKFDLLPPAQFPSPPLNSRSPHHRPDHHHHQSPQPPRQLPPPQHHHHDHDHEHDHDHDPEEEYDDEDDDDAYSDELSDDEYSDDDVSSSVADAGSNRGGRSRPADFFNFGNSLTVKGGILTVADDLLKNDGKKFIEMMEQLAERRMQREEEAVMDARDYDDDDDYDDEEDDEDYDDEDEEAEVMTEEQRMEEGRRMFQIFAARMFEQRVLTAYREKVAQERQRKLLEELEEETRLKLERDEKKAREKQKAKDKKKQQKLAKEEERAKREAEKAAAEAAAKAVEQAKQEETRRKKAEAKAKRDAEKKAAEEERKTREEERRKRQQEERDREAEAERKRKTEKEEKERQRKEEQARKEKEAKEKKEREERERKEKAATAAKAASVKAAVPAVPSATSPTKAPAAPAAPAHIAAPIHTPSHVSTPHASTPATPARMPPPGLSAPAVPMSPPVAAPASLAPIGTPRTHNDLPPHRPSPMGQPGLESSASLLNNRPVMNGVPLGFPMPIGAPQQAFRGFAPTSVAPGAGRPLPPPGVPHPAFGGVGSIPIPMSNPILPGPIGPLPSSGFAASSPGKSGTPPLHHAFDEAPKPISRPAPIQRPSAGTIGSPSKEVEELSHVLGSRALLEDDDEEEIIPRDRRTSQAPPSLPRTSSMSIFGGNSLLPDPIGALKSPDMNGHRSGSVDQVWGSPLGLGGNMWSMNAGGWPTAEPQPFGVGPDEQATLRDRARRTCLKLDEHQSVTGNFYPLETVSSGIRSLFPDALFDTRELIDACALPGTALNGGGSFQFKQQGPQVLVKFQEPHATPAPIGMPVSPQSRRAAPSSAFGSQPGIWGSMTGVF